MAKNSKIEWCNHTFNPWIGCAKVSPGCANCYAETQNNYRKWNPNGWGKGKPRTRTNAAYWNQPIKWNRAAMGEKLKHEIDHDQALRRGEAPAYKPLPSPLVFCSSLADWLDDEVPIQWLADLMRVIVETPHLNWLLLTKRPQNFQKRIYQAYMEVACGSLAADNMMCLWHDGSPPANVWVGTTVEDQQRADERIPHLLEIPARIRFLSCEPLIGPVTINHIRKDDNQWFPLQHIHWVICGGESGPNARPMHPEWALSLRDQCQKSSVPFLFKQWGEWLPRTLGIMSMDQLMDPNQKHMRLSIDGKNGQTDDCDGSQDEWMGRVGKKTAGRLLDDREWNEFPPTH